MLRVKVSLTYLVLVGLLIASSIGFIQMNVGEIIDADTNEALRRTVVGAEQSTRLGEASLLARARFVASSDRLYRSLKGEFVGDKAGEEGGERAVDVDVEGQLHLDAHEKLSAAKYRLDEVIKAQKDLRDEERHPLAREPHELDIFMVLDDKGVGVAALGKDLYSWFGADIAKQFPSLKETASGDMARIEYWMWTFKPADEKRLYRVAIAPVRRTTEEAPAGIVVVGAMISDGLAKKKQALFVGSEGASLDGAPEIAFYHGDTVVGSTFGADAQKAVGPALGEAGLMSGEVTPVTPVMVGEVPHLAISRPFSRGEKPVGVIVIANRDLAQAPLTGLRVNVLLVGVVVLLFGIFLLVLIIVRYIKPVEDLEDGVQEVIAGNKDYVWAQISGHELQSAMAQQLNLMSAFLQGKPMPDDEDAGQGWGELMPGKDQKPQGPGQVQGVDLAGLMGAKPPKKDEGES